MSIKVITFIQKQKIYFWDNYRVEKEVVICTIPFAF